MLPVSRPIYGVDHPEASLSLKGESLGVVLHLARLGTGVTGMAESMLDEKDVSELRAAADASQMKVDQMVGGGGPASDAEAFVFDAEMIHLFADQLVSISELLEQLTRRVEALETEARGASTAVGEPPCGA